MGVRELLLLPFARAPPRRTASRPPPRRTAMRRSRPSVQSCRLPKTRVAEASITLDDVRVFVHIGPTRATFADVMEALQSAVDRLQISDQAQNCDEARKAA